MARVTFQSYPYAVTKTFDCPSCGKTKRQRKIKAECTVNPFNRGADGLPLSPSQVREQSKAQATKEAEEFMRRPLCATCENSLGYQGRKEIYAARKAGA